MTQELTKIDFSDNAKVVLEHRFLSEGETPEERMWAMCNYVASAEKNYNYNMTGSFLTQTEQKANNVEVWTKLFYNELIVPKKFFPNSPTIVNAGSKNKKGGLQGCNVISPQDTMESIYQTVKDWALTEKFGAGIGAYFGDIRAKGSPIATTHGKALGPIAVMKILSESSKWITQGSFREGAHMAILPIDHADILEFIHCKDECKSPDDVLHNFNISIQMPDWFMEAVITDQAIKRSENIEHVIGSIFEKGHINVTQLWKEICKSAWKTGDPGLFFINRIRETEPNPQLGLIQAPNPCGEQPLENYNSCNLGSINLGLFVIDSNYNNPQDTMELLRYHSNSKKEIDWDSLKKTIHLAVRFLDDVIDVNIFPEDVPQLSEMNQKTRRIGLGVMGWHDMLVKLNIPYESEEAINLAKEISLFLSKEAWLASANLAEEKGEFPEWLNSREGKMGTILKTRNSCVTTVAPTGTLNILAGCSSGIEPYYSLYTERKTLWSQGVAQETIIEIPDTVKEYITKIKYTTDLDINQIYEVKRNTDLFQTALEISPEWHIKHQAAWQENITNGISKTINLPNNATLEDVSNAYILAWKLGCKGATIYRDGSKNTQVLNVTEETTKKMEQTLHPVFEDTVPVIKIHPIKRPAKLEGDTTRILTGHGKAYVTVNSINGTPIEVFCENGKAGKCDSASTEAITRLISLCLRSQIDPNEVVEQLRNITCCPIWEDGFHIMSVPDAISKVLHDHINNSVLTKENFDAAVNKIHSQTYEDPNISDSINHNLTTETTMNICIECGGEIIHEEGCMKCLSCGWTKC